MTYGLDECRRCGAPIRPRRDGEHVDQRPSRMPEAEWRAAGFKVRPTVAEAMNPGAGCCTDCQALFLRKRWKPGLRLAGVLVAIPAILLLIFWLGTIYVP